MGCDKYGLIYCVSNAFNDMVYIGQTKVSISERWRSHRSPQSKSVLSRAIRKYGAENFLIEEICSASSQEELDFLEREFIQWFDCIAPSGYNLKLGGNGGSRHHETTKKKIGKITKIAMRRNWDNPEYRKAQLESQRGAQTDAALNSLRSDKQRDNWKNPEYRMKLVAARRSRPPVDDEFRERMRVAARVGWEKRRANHRLGG